MEPVATEYEEWSKSFWETTLLQLGSIHRRPERELIVQVSNVSRSSKTNPDPFLADNTGMYVALLSDLEKRVASQTFHVSGPDRIFLLT